MQIIRQHRGELLDYNLILWSVLAQFSSFAPRSVLLSNFVWFHSLCINMTDALVEKSFHTLHQSQLVWKVGCRHVQCTL